ncbi:arrestin domain-containing protein 17 [Ditylenchus destructor]|uniref:Arrestin domain-containing protein 17 n=1 Tax=Ditylenchus destructor TaxID=166010 RepID=A0AAD4MI20_9BILA|nr:arrestin domain-containing protein 17 [Ditylenchus destructor]
MKRAKKSSTTTKLSSHLSRLPNLSLKLALLDRAMETFRIELESPSGVLFPGQVVQGRVYIHLREQIKARAVLLHVVGKAKTSWTVWERRTDNRNNNGSVSARTHSESIPYSAEVVYLDLQMNVWQPVEQILLPGLHDFPFTFTLPVHCPPSFEGTIGFIRFYCKAKIDRPWKFDDNTRTNFTVMPHFDLNTIYYAGLPVEKHISKNIGVLCFKHGRIGAKITLGKSGYVPGENVMLNVEVNNTTSKDVTRVETSLIELVTYTARRHNRLLDYGNGAGCHHGDVEKKQESRVVVQYNEEFKVCSQKTGTYQRLLAIPPIVPSFNICPIIQVDYQFKIKIVAKGTISNTVSGTLPVLIGTIPVRQQAPPQQAQVPSQDYLEPPPPTAPQPGTPIGIVPAFPAGPPPSYADSVFGRGTVQDDSEDKSGGGYTPRYVFYNNI